MKSAGLFFVFAVLVLQFVSAGDARSQPKAFDPKALEQELRLRDRIDRELRRNHDFVSPEVRVGDILTFMAVSVSGAGLLIALARDRALRRKEYADRIRHGAALIVVKADRWCEISFHFFDEIQPAIVDTDALLKTEPAESIRDFWWKEVVSAHADTRKAILDEEIENAYLDLYGYDPSVQQLFLSAMTDLRTIDNEIYGRFLRDTQEIIASTPLPYFSAKLGNPLRRSSRARLGELERRTHQVVTALRAQLLQIVDASDSAIVRKVSPMAASHLAATSTAADSIPLPARNKWALLVAIDRLPKIGLRNPDLGSCNDLALFDRLLQGRFGFQSDHVIRLINDGATRTAIIDALDAISITAQSGDVVLFCFFGNGSLFLDKARGEVHATVVPYDSGRTEGQNFDISEMELNRYFNAISKSRRLVALLDTCYSGGMCDNQDALRILHAAHDNTPPWAARGLGPTLPEIADGHGLTPGIPLRGDYTLLTAAHKNETAYTFRLPDGNYHGAFSYFVATALAEAAPTASLRQVFAEASGHVSRLFPRQNPQIEGNADSKLRDLFGAGAGLLDLEPNGAPKVIDGDCRPEAAAYREPKMGRG